MQALSNAYYFFEKFNFHVTHYTERYKAKHKNLIKDNSDGQFKCFSCFETVKEDYQLKKLAFDLEVDDEKKSIIGDQVEEIIKNFRVKIHNTTSSNLIRHLKINHENDVYQEFLQMEKQSKQLNTPKKA